MMAVPCKLPCPPWFHHTIQITSIHFKPSPIHQAVGHYWFPGELCYHPFHSENDTKILSRVCARKISPLGNFQPFWASSFELRMFSNSFASHGCHLLLHDPLLLRHLWWCRFHPALGVFKWIFGQYTDCRSCLNFFCSRFRGLHIWPGICSGIFYFSRKVHCPILLWNRRAFYYELQAEI